MPLLKKALQPVNTSPVTSPAVTDVTPPMDKKAKKLQPDSLDAKSRLIQRQGAFQAALQSPGVMQHRSATFADYLAGVREAADAELAYINE